MLHHARYHVQLWLDRSRDGHDPAADLSGRDQHADRADHRRELRYIAGHVFFSLDHSAIPHQEVVSFCNKQSVSASGGLVRHRYLDVQWAGLGKQLPGELHSGDDAHPSVFRRVRRLTPPGIYRLLRSHEPPGKVHRVFPQHRRLCEHLQLAHRCVDSRAL